MGSIQEREQTGEVSTDSGFFEKGRGFVPSGGFPGGLSGAGLSGAGLSGAGLSGGELSGGELSGGAMPNDAVSSEAIRQSAVGHSPVGYDVLGHGTLGHGTLGHGALGHGAGEHAFVHDAVADVPDPLLQAFGEVRGLNMELQRANDALHVVNETLRDKVDQLRATALDLEQMIDGLEAGVLLLDEELAIRHFNDMAAHFLGLGAHDVGGSVSASCRGFGPRLMEWCHEVLRSGRRIRRTFQSAIGEPLTLHIRRTRVDGEARLILVFTETA